MKYFDNEIKILDVFCGCGADQQKSGLDIMLNLGKWRETYHKTVKFPNVSVLFSSSIGSKKERLSVMEYISSGDLK